MFGFKLVRETKDEDVPSVKFDVKDYDSRNQANTFNDLMFFDGAISKESYENNKIKIRKTKGVMRYVEW